MTPSSLTSHRELSESERSALLKLLADEDPEVYRQIRDRITAIGPEAVKWLKPHTRSSDPVLRRRALSIIREFETHAADNEFVGLCLNTGEDLPLERGVWLLARTAYPEISVEGYTALLDEMAGELQKRMEDMQNPRQVLRIMRVFLFKELGFAGDQEDYYNPENSYLNRVIDRRLGNPISLSTLYILLARRLQMPVTGIGLPGHFVCRYQTSSVELYIDVFHQGSILTKADCIRHLQSGHYGFKEEFLAPVSSRRMLLRMCSNLHQIYSQDQRQEATRFHRYVVALSREG